MTALEKMRDFLESYPDYDQIARFDIDFTDNVPNAAGLFPSGLVEVRRERDILGDVTVTNQYNFALYTAFEKYEGAAENAEWEIGLQEWVQEQSARRLAPTFGDTPWTESIRAQNGQLFSVDDEGTALYVMQINATFQKRF